MAFVFGLSLSNHWPLMLLFAPAFIALLWPRIGELLRRLPLLVPLVALGLWPYAWMVFNSLSGPPASFDGPLESFADFWFFVSRAGYAGVDVSATSTWLDRIRFFEFQGAELLAQFAVAGTMVAAAGFAAQWSVLGRRISIGLTAGFLMTTACLLLLLGFDYDAVRKQMYSVYPLPAYGVAALWMAIGFDWLARRFRARATHAAIAGAALLAAILVAGSRQNLLEHYDWPARYAGAVLRALPRDAVVFVNGDPDLAPIAYLHMIEGRRPDITLYQPQGLILGNRLFHPLHTDKATASARIRELIDRTDGPVAFTLSTPEDYARKDHWLFVTVDKSSRDPARSTPEVPEELVRFFEDSLMDVQESNPWMAYFQGELRRRYGGLLAIRLARGQAPDARSQRQLDALARDYFGSLGVVEGMMANKQGYSVAAIARFLDAARDRMPGDIGKNHKARYFELRGYVRLETGDRKGGVADLEEAVSVWPAKANGAATALAKLYAAAGDGAAAERLQARLK